ncbi:MAG: glycosyltransferase family 4 protein [Candidatus Aenigmarchaeota archaeon]|nr:glycosyltransferase family 4 protein [Candidatus Aenigmarchaeota archaeon]
MRLGFLSLSFTRSSKTEAGSSVYAGAFIKNLEKEKSIDEIKVITVGISNEQLKSRFGRAEVYRVNCKTNMPITNYEFAIRLLNKESLIKDVDIIHSQHTFEGIFAEKCKRKFKTPYVLVNEVLPNRLTMHSKIHFGLEKFFIEHLNYDYLVSWSTHLAKNYFYKWEINHEKIKIIPSGIDTEAMNPFKKIKNIRPLFNIEKNDFLFLSVKIFSKSNTLGLINSILAFEKFLKYANNAKYIIVGFGGGEVVLRKLIKKLDIQNNVILAGAVKRSELINYYRSSDATLHYFAYEPSISISIMESLACGTPIISTNNGEMKYLVDNSVALLVNPDISEMTSAMKTLYEDSSLRKKMTKNCWKLVSKKFDLGIIVKKYIELYETCLSS